MVFRCFFNANFKLLSWARFLEGTIQQLIISQPLSCFAGSSKILLEFSVH